MDELPWLVVHGMAAFRVALAVAMAGGVLLFWLGPRVAVRREARRARARLGASSPLVDLREGATVTLSGELAALGACERFEDRGEAAAASVAFRAGPLHPVDAGSWVPAASMRAATLTVKSASAVLERELEVELVGPVAVLAGSRELRPNRPLGRVGAGLQARIGARLDGRMPALRIPILRSVAAGDRVRVRGVLRREAKGDGHGGYRHAPGRWTLVGEAPNGTPLPIPIACERAAAIAGPRWPRLVKGMAGGGALFAFLSWATATAVSTGAPRELRSARYDLDGQRADAMLSSYSIAAASPLHRRHVLDETAVALESRCLFDYDRRHVERIVAIDELRGDCRGAVSALMLHGQLARAAARASACGLEREVARADYLLGRFEEASEAIERSGDVDSPFADALFDARVHLLAGRPELAAPAARRARDRLAYAGTELFWSRDARPGREALACVADALDARRGDLDALARLRAGARTTGASECKLLLADGRPGESPASLESLKGVPGSMAQLLAMQARLGLSHRPGARFAESPIRRDVPLVLDRPSLLLLGYGELRGEVYNPALVQRLLETLGPEGSAEDRGKLAASAAAFESITGDHREARRWMSEALRDLERSEHHGQALLLAAAIEINAGDLPEARSRLGEAASLPGLAGDADARQIRHFAAFRERASAELLDDYPHLPEPWRIAWAGDGAKLAAWLQRHDAEDLDASVRFGALMLTGGREDLLEWLRWGDRRVCVSCGADVRMVEVARRHAVAESLGDGALAEELWPTVEAFHHALLRRDLAVPLAVLDGR